MKIKLNKGALSPTVAHPGDAGIDLYSPVDIVVPAGGSAVIDTGVSMEIPGGYFGLICPRSGLNLWENVVTFGSVIDSGYRGTVRVKLYNLTRREEAEYQGQKDYTIHAGDRICQLVIIPYISPSLQVVDALDSTERGTDGFGSSGR